MTEDWRERALCADMADETYADSDPFFPNVPENAGDELERLRYGEARSVCGVCPIREECLRRAMQSEKPGRREGMLGGLTPRERDRLGQPNRVTTKRRSGTAADVEHSHPQRMQRWRDGFTDPQMAAAEGVTKWAISGWRKKHGLQDNWRNRAEAINQQFLALYEQGYPDREIARATGEHRDRVRHWRNRNGLPTIPQRQLVTA